MLIASFLVRIGLAAMLLFTPLLTGCENTGDVDVDGDGDVDGDVEEDETESESPQCIVTARPDPREEDCEDLRITFTFQDGLLLEYRESIEETDDRDCNHFDFSTHYFLKRTAGRLESIASLDRDGNLLQLYLFTYDEQGRLERGVLHIGEYTNLIFEYVYNEAGRIESRRDQAPYFFTYGYTGDGRLQSKSHVSLESEQVDYTYEYDDAHGTMTQYNGSPDLKPADRVFHYDADGRIVHEVWPPEHEIRTEFCEESFETIYEYDRHGLLTLRNPMGNTTYCCGWNRYFESTRNEHGNPTDLKANLEDDGRSHYLFEYSGEGCDQYLDFTVTPDEDPRPFGFNAIQDPLTKLPTLNSIMCE